MAIHIIAVTPAANRTAINAVLEALGHGPDNLSTKLTTVPSPTWETEPTHYMVCWQNTPAGLAEMFWAFAEDVLPPTAGEWPWGEWGVISEEDARAAITPENFAVQAFNEAFTPEQQIVATLASFTPPLIRIPYPDP